MKNVDNLFTNSYGVQVGLAALKTASNDYIL